MDANEVIRHLALTPHPEGGWYREVYRSASTVGTQRGPRTALTTIYYLLERHELSRWHVVDADESWHFYGGAPLELFLYEPGSLHLRRRVLAPPSPDSEPVDVVRREFGRRPGASAAIRWSVAAWVLDLNSRTFVSCRPYPATRLTSNGRWLICRTSCEGVTDAPPGSIGP